MFSKILLPQQDSIKEAVKFYPLHVGDYWQYQVERRGDHPSDSASWISHRKVVKDTIMTNNIKYYLVEEKSGAGNSLYNRCIRVDTNTANVYLYSSYDSLEYMIDSLN